MMYSDNFKKCYTVTYSTTIQSHMRERGSLTKEKDEKHSTRDQLEPGLCESHVQDFGQGK